MRASTAVFGTAACRGSRNPAFGGLGVGRRSERFGATATSCGHDHQAAQADQDHRHSTSGDETGSSRTRDGGSAARLDFLKDPGQLIEWPGHRPRLGVRWRDGGCRRCSGRRRRCRPWRSSEAPAWSWWWSPGRSEAPASWWWSALWSAAPASWWSSALWSPAPVVGGGGRLCGRRRHVVVVVVACGRRRQRGRGGRRQGDRRGFRLLDGEHLAVGEPRSLFHDIDLPQARGRLEDVEADVAVLISGEGARPVDDVRVGVLVGHEELGRRVRWKASDPDAERDRHLGVPDVARRIRWSRRSSHRQALAGLTPAATPSTPRMR